MPIIQQKAGLIVIESFITALSISIIFLIIFIYLIFKRFLYVLVSTLSLLIAFMFSIFIMILFNINLNFANMIALPLLYSLGISFTIYFIRRFIQYDRKIDNVIKSNTPKAIFFSAATTMGSFTTLAISNHSGTSSMGLLLFICLLMTVLSAVFILPVLLSSFKFSTK
jgi:Predicted exporters of the RND superfamily